ncbi:MAG: tetratricopeptide repeat protein [Candidatus Tectomicrobia bacterium]|nr:tetratricopeptide repeat protein [Candidatus Tectomicrobia bacterium]
MVSRVARRSALPALLLLALAYAGSLANDFTYDDGLVIAGNPFILSWANLSDFLSARYLARSGELSYRPIVTLSYMVDAAIWGVRPFGFHLTNLLLHALNVTLWWLLVRTWLSPVPAFGVALLAAVHPAPSEAVLAIAYREELLFTLFGLAMLLLLATRLRQGRALSSGACVGVWVCFALALLSKEMALSLPLIVLLLMCWRPAGVARIAVERLRRHGLLLAGLLLCSAAYLVLRFLVLREPSEARLPPLDPGWWRGPLTMLTVAAHDVRLFLLPVTLRAEHDLNVVAAPYSARLLVSLLILVVLAWLGWRSRRRQPPVTAGLLWCGLALLPVLNLVPIANPSAERYLYFPFLGLGLAVGGGLERALSAKRPTDVGAAKRGAVGRKFSCTLVVPACLILASFLLLTRQRGAVWHDNLSLWQATLAWPSSRSRPYHNLADAWLSRAESLAAKAEQLGAATPGPEDKVRRSRAEAREARRRAALLYGEALRRNPAGYESFNNLGNLYRDERAYARALLAYAQALRVNPGYADAWNNLGITYKRLWRRDRAIVSYLRSIALRPEAAATAAAYKNLGIALLEAGGRRRARQLFVRSLTLNPGIAEQEELRRVVERLAP